MARRQDNALQYWKRLWQGKRTELCYISKLVDNAMGQFSAILKIKWRGDRTMLCNIGKEYDRATGQ
jgi:hypothetical protein